MIARAFRVTAIHENEDVGSTLAYATDADAACDERANGPDDRDATDVPVFDYKVTVRRLGSARPGEPVSGWVWVRAVDATQAKASEPVRHFLTRFRPATVRVSARKGRQPANRPTWSVAKAGEPFKLPLHQIDYIVGRCHVGESNVRVIRYLRSRMFLANPLWNRERRKSAYRYAIARHAANRRLYQSVMSGRF